MAVQHLLFNPNLPHGLLLAGLAAKIRDIVEAGPNVLAAFDLMVDGNGSDPAHFTYLAARLGCPDNATAKGIWDELHSAFAKLTTDQSVTFTNAALKQLCNKLR